MSAFDLDRQQREIQRDVFAIQYGRDEMHLAQSSVLESCTKGNPLPSLSVVDQFVQEKSYYHYLEGQDNVVKDLHFETKAESKYLAVAAASVLARATF